MPPPLPLSSRLERERGYALDPLRRRRWTLALLVLRWKEKAEQQQQQERQRRRRHRRPSLHHLFLLLFVFKDLAVARVDGLAAGHGRGGRERCVAGVVGGGGRGLLLLLLSSRRRSRRR